MGVSSRFYGVDRITGSEVFISECKGFEKLHEYVVYKVGNDVERVSDNCLEVGIEVLRKLLRSVKNGNLQGFSELEIFVADLVLKPVVASEIKYKQFLYRYETY